MSATPRLGKLVASIGNEPIRMRCPYCNTNIVTTMEYRANIWTHCCALALCLLIWWPLACIPYCINSCQSIHHYCPNCDAFIGAYDK